MKGSSRIFTDKARAADSFNPRNDVKYSISFSSSFGADVELDATVEVDPFTALDSSTVFAGSTGVDFAPNADVVPALDDLPNAPNADVLSAAVGGDVTVEAGVSTFAGAAGAPKLNPEKGVLLALDPSLVGGFEVLAVPPNAEIGAAVLVVEVDAGVVVAVLLPKLKPEEGLLGAGVVVDDEVVVAGAPKATGALGVD